ncbi:iron-containing alcohol dehydrogenase family protein [Gorillibacterium sp. sgz5001074]|uniref:iron-containing alcohol dehydrogenase family protein n=1 Tax=Gorillibacterium sp. sgz5001074 TaxID=3446695 RepID=UPI003F66EBD0
MQGSHYVAGTPNAYIQEPGLIGRAGEWISRFGRKVFLVTGVKSWEAAGAKLADSLERAGINYRVERYGGECTYGEADRLKQLVEPGTELIVGVGAGKVTDTAKKLANDLSLPLVTIPTLAATCAPVTNLSIMYTEEGVYMDFPVFYRNTLLTLVDTEVIAAAPPRYLAAGIGDTIAKWVESKACSTGKPQNLPTIGGVQTAKLIFDTLLADSEQALEDARAQRPTPELQRVIDAVILFSGMVGGLGEDNCRSAAAHAVHNGLTTLPEMHAAYHGEKVAYGILVQLALERRPEEEIRELTGFYRSIGLPVKLRDMGLDRPLTGREMEELIRVSLSPEGTMANMPFPVTGESLAEAIRQVEAWTY